MSELDRQGDCTTTNLDTEVGKLVIDLGLATAAELEFCREQQKQSSDPNHRSLADLLVENNFVTPTQVRRIRTQVDDPAKPDFPAISSSE